jgi:hypothetical protein
MIPRMGGRSLSSVPCPLNLLARRRGGSSGSRCGSPFSPAFWYISFASTTGSSSGEGGKVFEGEALNVMTTVEQVTTTGVELVGEMERRHALAEAESGLGI